MKVGIITFHASHNYGSMLQAYALQQTILRMGHECEIINFRTDIQRSGYKPFYLRGGIRGVVKALLYPRFAYNDSRKHKLFEDFIKEKLILSEREYHTIDELTKADFDYDVYISGSDQIWNTLCFDFDWAYFLPFVKRGKKIAYAPSMGPDPENQVSHENDLRIAEYISKYDALSVRESRTVRRLKSANINKLCEVALDPTLLLNAAEWRRMISDKPLIEGKYIFLYTPSYDEKIFEKAADISDKQNFKVIVSIPDNIRKWSHDRRFRFYTAVGPIEFLNLINYSDIVVAKSFHAVVFSILLDKPYISVGGMDDSRVANLLEILKNSNGGSAAIDNSIKFLNNAISHHISRSAGL